MIKRTPSAKQRIIYILLLILILAVSYERGIFSNLSDPGGEATQGAVSRAWEQQLSDTQVRGYGVVEKVLPDDTKGSRHQRFIVRVGANHTVLIAHNIDLAPRVKGIARSDRVEFYGEYEWNEKGGVVHWTHHDPGGRHVGGWLKHDGTTYE